MAVFILQRYVKEDIKIIILHCIVTLYNSEVNLIMSLHKYTNHSL